jgi:uncharacterized protein YndB with AHSA1/START domain
MAAATSNRKAKLTLPTDNEILVTREFEAPRHLVYRAWTTPELVKRWWVGQRGKAISAEIDLRVGGRWRYMMVTHDGFEVAFHGEYKDVVPNERIVSTEIYEAAPEGEALNTITFAEQGDRTLVMILMQHRSKELRDMVLQTGMEGGLQEALDLLEGLAQSLAW